MGLQASCPGPFSYSKTLYLPTTFFAPFNPFAFKQLLITLRQRFSMFQHAQVLPSSIQITSSPSSSLPKEYITALPANLSFEPKKRTHWQSSQSSHSAQLRNVLEISIQSVYPSRRLTFCSLCTAGNLSSSRNCLIHLSANPSPENETALRESSRSQDSSVLRLPTFLFTDSKGYVLAIFTSSAIFVPIPCRLHTIAISLTGEGGAEATEQRLGEGGEHIRQV